MSKKYSDYTIADVSRLDGAFIKKEPEQMKAFKQVQGLLLSVNFPELRNRSLLETFPHPTTPNRMMETSADINAKFVELYEASKATRATEGYGLHMLVEHKADIVEATKVDFDTEISSSEARLRTTRIAYENYIHKANSRLTAIVTVKDKLEKLEKLKTLGHLDESMYDMVTSILANPFWQFVKYDKDESKLFFATTRSIHQKYINVAAGVNKECDMGYMMAEIDLSEGNFIRMRPFFGNLNSKSGDYSNSIHPNIGSGGAICWGTHSTLVGEYVEEKNTKGCMDILASLLMNYSTGTPFISLDTYISIANQVDKSGEGVSEPDKWYMVGGNDNNEITERSISDTYTEMADKLAVALDTSIIKNVVTRNAIAERPSTTLIELWDEGYTGIFAHFKSDSNTITLRYMHKDTDRDHSYAYRYTRVVAGSSWYVEGRNEDDICWKIEDYELSDLITEMRNQPNISNHVQDTMSIRSRLDNIAVYGKYFKFGTEVWDNYSDRKVHISNIRSRCSVFKIDNMSGYDRTMSNILPLFTETGEELVTAIEDYICWCEETGFEYNMDTINSKYPEYTATKVRLANEALAIKVDANTAKFEDKITCDNCYSTNGEVLPTLGESGLFCTPCHNCGLNNYTDPDKIEALLGADDEE